jgi:hypothetical protein
MLSLTSKVAAVYVQRFDDGVALNAANDVEQLCSGLARKLWQKIMILQDLPEPPGPGRPATAGFGAEDGGRSGSLKSGPEASQEGL